MKKYKTSFEAREGEEYNAKGESEFHPFIGLNLEGGTDNILLRFKEGTPFEIVEQVSALLDQHVKQTEITQNEKPAYQAQKKSGSKWV